MPTGVNQIILIGNCVREPEVRYTQDGSAIANLSLAVNRVWKNKQGARQEDATFFRCVLYGSQAEFAGQYATKGRQAYVEGRIQFRKYTAKDGVEREVTEVVARNFQMLGPKPEGQNTLPVEYRGMQKTQPEQVREAYAGERHYDESDVPF